MRKLALLLSASLVLSGPGMRRAIADPAEQAESIQRNATEAEVKEMQDLFTRYWQAWRDGDLEAVRRLMAEPPADMKTVTSAAPTEFRVLQALVKGDIALLVIVAKFPKGTAQADVFLKNKDGRWLFLEERFPPSEPVAESSRPAAVE